MQAYLTLPFPPSLTPPVPQPRPFVLPLKQTPWTQIPGSGSCFQGESKPRLFMPGAAYKAGLREGPLELDHSQARWKWQPMAGDNPGHCWWHLTSVDWHEVQVKELTISISSQFCIQWHHTGNLKMAMVKSVHTMKTGKQASPNPQHSIERPK